MPSEVGRVSQVFEHEELTVYIPKSFTLDDPSEVERYIRSHNFAALISHVDGRPFCTHLPFLFDREQNCLLGHMAAANPHCAHLKQQPEVLTIFNGPHAYVSPDYYANDGHVPTWNYVAIHVYGTVEFIDDRDQTDQVLRRSTSQFEADNGTSWSYDSLPDQLKASLFSAIKAFRIKIDSIEGKAKMSQNRRPEDIAGVVRGLQAVEQKDVASIVSDLNQQKLQ